MKALKIIFIIVILCNTNNIFAQGEKKYLNKNKEVIDTNGLEIVKSFEKDSSQIILLGENHGFKEPQQIDFIFLKYLNKYKGFKYYLAEIDYFQAYYFNKFLENGNDSILKLIFKNWYESNSQWANIDFFNKIKKIRILNQSLSPKNQIKFIGIDKIL